MIYLAVFLNGLAVGYIIGSWHDPAYRWGFKHPFGPPRPWWPRRRRIDWYLHNGIPWEK